MWWMLLAAAQAAFPVPDRPYVSRSASLVADNTLELELGYRYLQRSQVPATLKYSLKRVVEFRVQSNLAGIGAMPNTPELLAGAKIKLVGKEDSNQNFVALWLGSGVPVSDGEAWRGEFHVLYTTIIERTGLRVNTGVDFVGGDGLGFGGVPLRAAVTYLPVRRFGIIGELSGALGTPGCEELQCVYGNVLVQGGIRGRLTEVLVIDASGGYSFMDEAPFVGVGFTSNFGRVE